MIAPAAEERIEVARLTLKRMDSVVDQVETTTETTVSGGGTVHQIGGSVGGGTRISSSSTTYHNVFIPTPEGGLYRLQMDVKKMAFAPGHRLSVVWAVPDKAKLGLRLAAMRNHSTQVEEELRGPFQNGHWPELFQIVSWRFSRTPRWLFRLALLAVIGGIAFATTLPPQTLESSAEGTLAVLLIVGGGGMAVLALLWRMVAGIRRSGRVRKRSVQMAREGAVAAAANRQEVA
ncbi:MAG: hypothetical protein AAFS07_08105 [Pseudomonadota bacterium]